ncbi:ABC transporter permease (plasmid) [Rhodobacteraceae bacterium M382]|nr:ABC transporter permease [Rhodobacteraceae bacterium M382]
MLDLCLKSLLNRRFVAALTILSIALSVALILGVERLRTEARAGFANSVSGVDLIVAARGNDVQILMATVFGVGSTGTGLSWESYEMVENMPGIDWTVPLMMGDSHRGYPVVGTSEAYFERFRYSGGQSLTFAQGRAFDTSMGAVVGADVARAFGYGPGTEIVNAHGSGEVSFDIHDEAPFTISGVLAVTGTAVDRMVFVSLKGFDALHEDAVPENADPFAKLGGSDDGDEQLLLQDEHEEHEHETGHAAEGDHAAHTDHVAEADHSEHDDSGNEEPHDANAHAAHDEQGHDDHGHEPATINAIFAGLKSKTAILSVQRQLSEYRGDALTAVLPNVALLQLWSITGTAETALRLMAGAVALAGVIGMVVMLSATLDARRREFAILRSVGATPRAIFTLIMLEAVLLLLTGVILGYILLTTVMMAANPVLMANFGLKVGFGLPSFREALLIAFVFCSGLVAGAIPAFRVYRMTLADGLSLRL